MIKHYFVRYPRDFANEYDLGWSYDESVPGWERITRREAVAMARAEVWRCRWTPTLSGCAPVLVFPIPGDNTPGMDDYDAYRIINHFPVVGWQVVDRVVCPED